MKSAATTLFTLLLLSTLISSYLPSTKAEVVLDIDGNPLSNGGKSYYILPVFRGRGGGVELAKTGNETCPLSVAQSSFEVSNGLPIIISSPLRITIISEGFPLTLSFTSVPICSHSSSKWTIVDGSVKITSHDEDTVQGWFRIEKYNLDYKLVFCPTSTDVCGDIGIYIHDNGIRSLVLNENNENNPFIVQFKLAYGSSFASA